VREPSFWPRFFWIEHVARFFSGAGYHEGPWWLPTAFLLAGGLPVTALLPAALLGLRRRGLGAPAVRFALCWLLVPLALVSASKGKLGTYVLPCFPPLALLIALGLEGKEAPLRPARWGARVLAGAVGLGALGLALAQLQPVRDLFHPGAPALFGAAENDRLAAFVAGLALSAVGFAWAARGRLPARIALRLAAAAAPIFLVAATCLPQRVTEGHSPAPLLERNQARLAEAGALVSTSYDAPALALYARRSDILITGSPGELRWGLSFPAGLGRLVTPQDLVRRLATLPADTSMIVLSGRGRFEEDLRPALGPPARVDRQLDFVLAEWRGRAPGSVSQEQPHPLDGRQDQ
jgi:4-amino-4-deoxy-L-arabinose transferase